MDGLYGEIVGWKAGMRCGDVNGRKGRLHNRKSWEDKNANEGPEICANHMIGITH